MSAAQGTAGTRAKTVKKILLGVAATLVLVLLGGGVVWTTTCPCETMPGFVLLGASNDAPVTACTPPKLFTTSRSSRMGSPIAARSNRSTTTKST